MRKTGIVLALLAPALLLYAEEAPSAKARDAQAKGVLWLLEQQQPDGSFAPDVGITGLAVTALARSGHAKSPEVEKAVSYLLKHVHEDGAIYNDDGMGLYNYRTSVALMAMAAADPLKYKDAIRKAQDYLAGTQRREATGTPKDDPKHGGIGYGSDPGRNDMSNLQIALQALKESGYQNDEVFQRAAEFAGRCQNLQATNPMAKDPDAKVAVGDDGGFVYGPMEDVKDTRGPVGTAADGKPVLVSYGSMTYAGLLTMVYAKLTKEDPRVSAAMDWIRKHYTLADNPGMATPEKPAAGKQGLYYYYLTFAKSMKAYGETHVETPDKAKHRWAEDLLGVLVQAQKPDGMWVNEDSERWMEGNPVLATSYALLAVQICREDLGK